MNTELSEITNQSRISENEWPYPRTDPRQTGYVDVDVDPDHRIYWEEYGNPAGEVVIVLHGGPGASCSPDMARYFDPARYRVILFDQRGCGRSEPTVASGARAEALTRNTTTDLIADIDKLRRSRGIIGKMHLFGGSWGSTLAMCYAIAHPDNCATLILRGIFLGSADDLLFIYQGNAASYETAPYELTAPGAYVMYPDAWRNFLRLIPSAERHDMMGAYARRLEAEPATGNERQIQIATAKAWSTWERAISHAVPSPLETAEFCDSADAINIAHIEAHYFSNHLFLEPDFILRNAAILAQLPIHIVHGRFDAVCPLPQAWRLVAALRHAGSSPASFAITCAGHSGLERESALALATIMDTLPFGYNTFRDDQSVSANR